METDPVFWAAEIYSFLGVLAAAIIFTRLALKAGSIGTFRFQLSLFILIWVAAEVPHILDTLGVIDVSSYLQLGLMLHFLSMMIFAIFVGLRSLRFIYPKTPSPKGFFSIQPPSFTNADPSLAEE